MSVSYLLGEFVCLFVCLLICSFDYNKSCTGSGGNHKIRSNLQASVFIIFITIQGPHNVARYEARVGGYWMATASFKKKVFSSLSDIHTHKHTNNRIRMVSNRMVSITSYRVIIRHICCDIATKITWTVLISAITLFIGCLS